MVLDNDTRGWIMAVVSGIGPSAICKSFLSSKATSLIDR